MSEIEVFLKSKQISKGVRLVCLYISSMGSISRTMDFLSEMPIWDLPQTKHSHFIRNFGQFTYCYEQFHIGVIDK